jgi:hypothetical protein
MAKETPHEQDQVGKENTSLSKATGEKENHSLNKKKEEKEKTASL